MTSNLYLNNDVNTYYNALGKCVEFYNLNEDEFDSISKLHECVLKNLKEQLNFESKEQSAHVNPSSPLNSRAIKTIFR